MGKSCWIARVAIQQHVPIQILGNPELYDPTDTCRPTSWPTSRPTPTISSFFTVIYTALKSPIHSFEFPYDIHNRAESVQYTNEYADLSIKC